MAEKLICCGRYKNRTFEYVYTTDKDYCYNVYNDSQNYRDDLNEFKKYLVEKFENLTISTPTNPDPKNIIRKIFGKGFVTAFNDEHRRELSRLISNYSKITVHAVAEKTEKNKTCSILGLFYRLFAKKLLYSTVKTANVCYNSSLEMLLNIFPVPLRFKRNNNGIGSTEDDETSRIIKALRNDQSALMEIEQCMSTYKFDVSDVLTDAANMLTIINQFDGKGRIVVDDVTKSLLDIDFFLNSRPEYLTVFNRHFLFYQSCKDSCLNFLKYRDRPCPFKVIEQDQLSQRMDALYNYRIYVTHTEDTVNIVQVIFKLAAFIDSHWSTHQVGSSVIEDVDYSVLKNIIRYVENLGSSENFVLNPSTSFLNYIERKTSDAFTDEELLNIVSTGPDKLSENFVLNKCFLKCGHTLYTDGSLIEFHFSNRTRRATYDFHQLILCASLLPLPCIKLVIFNPRLGEESQLKIDKEKEPIKNFIRKFRHPDAWKDVHFLGDLV